MCGIVGFAGANCWRRIASPDETLSKMADSIRYRGPDDSGFWLGDSPEVGLGHRRLSIVDLSLAGHQPMVSASGRYVIVFNGEIYNHRTLRKELEGSASNGGVSIRRGWRGMSDTETLLEGIAEWGIAETIRKCVGMFAFAIWDRKDRVLSLARDRAGEKPLYYYLSAGFLAFGSEPKALLEVPDFERKLDRESLVAYLAFGYVPGGKSMFAGVRKLPPACILSFGVASDTCAISSYWELPAGPFATPGPKVRANDLVDQLESLLESSVQGQLQADVPVAVLLSGGVDSSLVAALAARVAGRIRTFTIGFPGAKVHDERRHARLIANHFCTEHVEIPLERAALDLVTGLSKSLDEPLCDSSILPTYLVSEAVRKHVTVVLGGDGGDELFAGYRAYNMALGQATIRRSLPLRLRKLAASAARRVLPPGVKGRSYLSALDCTMRQAAARAVMLFDRSARGELLNHELFAWVPNPEQLRENFAPEIDSPIQTATRMDFHSYLPDDLLAKVDRASMLCSLEVRAPFLDHRVVEFAFGCVPDALKATGFDRKILPRLLAKRLFPPNFELRRKQGFSIPLQEWLGKGAATALHEAVRELPPGLINAAYAERLFTYQARGYNNSERIFGLALLSLWLREYRISY